MSKWLRESHVLLAPALCTFAVATVSCARGAAVAPDVAFSKTLPAFHEGFRVAVVGDLQRTAPLLEIWREQNDAERARVVAAIADARPDVVLITGDCVFNGGSDAQWSAFDRLSAPLREAGVPVASAFGNHEYWMGKSAAEAHVFPRFPLDGNRHWFTLAVGPLRIVVLDSNAKRLGEGASEGEWSSEVAWFGNTLDDFDRDADVRGVIVAFHHPPYTNSTVTGDDPDVQHALVPPFARAHKTLAMLGGHVHSYERFERDGKMYVVSGGGGGPRAELATGPERRHPDDLFDGPALRDFNFTTYTVTERGVSAEVHGLARGGSAWRVMDRFEMEWSGGSEKEVAARALLGDVDR